LLPNELQDVIECLPPLDFYLPVPSHREVWDGRTQVIVAGMLDLDEGPIHAYEEGGHGQAFSREDPIPGTPILVFHPAEPKSELDADRQRRSETNPLVLLDYEDTHTELDYVYVSFDDGFLGGAVELSILASFDDGFAIFATDSIYEEFTPNSGTPNPWNIPLFAERMPDSSLVHVHLLFIEEDLFDRDTVAVEIVYWQDNHDNVTVMDGAEPVLTYRLGWTARTPQLLDSISVPTVNVDEGDYENALVSVFDQYGYRIRFADSTNEDADVTNHFVNHTSIATAGSASEGTAYATIPIYGAQVGWTQLVTTVGLRTSSITDTTYVNVLSSGDCGEPICPEGGVVGPIN
jgi:hypothetical protein